MKNILHNTRLSLPEKDRVEIISMLNLTLASTSDLYAQLKQAHWNVKGPQFIALHKLFDDIAKQIENQVDTIAEQITSLGGTAFGTLQQAVENTQLRIYPTNIFKAEEHIEHLSHNISILGEIARNSEQECQKLGDVASSDVYIDLIRILDKNLWFIEAHIQKQ